MNRPPESPRWLAQWPTSSPSDTLLKNFRATLETRWAEFDKATLQEAEKEKGSHPLGWLLDLGVAMGMSDDLKTRRDNDPKFLAAKATFDETKAILASITSDEELKKNAAVLAKVESTLQSITKYLAEDVKPEERNKSHNIILAKTKADLADFRAKLTGKPEDAREAVIASEAERSIPRPAIVAAGAAAATVPLISSAEAAEVKSELVWEARKMIGPWGMIFGKVQEAPIKDVADQIKSLSKEWKETGWTNPLGKIWSGIKFFLLKWQIGRANLDLSKVLSPEELAQAGLRGAPETPTPQAQKPQEQANTSKENIRYLASVDILLKFWQNREERQENVLWWASIILKEPWFQSISVASLKKAYDPSKKEIGIWWFSKSEQDIINKIPLEASQKQKAINLIARLFFDTSNTIQSEVSRSLLGGGEWVSVRSSILSASKNLRRFTPFGSIDLSNPQAMIQEWVWRYIPTIDPTSQELTGELADDYTTNMGKKNAIWIFWQARNFPVPQDQKGIDDHFTLENPSLPRDPEDQKKLRNILQFWVNFRQLIRNESSINLGKWEKITGALSNVFTLWELGILYTFLEGKTDLSAMTGIEKGFIMMKIADMLSTWNPELNGEYSTAIAWVFLGKPTNIPPEVKSVFSDMLSYATDKAGNTIGDTGKWLWWSAKENPAVALSMLAALLFGPWFTKRGSLAGALRK
jgi:hypothetical protein